MELIKISEEYLKLYNLTIPDKYFKDRIISHPNYPSLLSLTDTLDELGIEYSAVKVEKSEIKELDFPLLCHIVNSDGSGDFEIFHSSSQVESDANLFEKWDGIVLGLAENATIKNIDCKTAIRKRQKESSILKLFILLFFCLTAFVVISTNFLNIIAYTSLSVIGIFVSLSLILQTLGKGNTLISKLCGVDDQSGCEVIKKSSGSKILGIKLEDAGFIYFVTLLLYIIVGNLISQTLSFTTGLFIASTLSLPVTIYSLYYQRVVLKKWCPLCLVIISILWLQFLVIFPYSTNIEIIITNITYHALLTGLLLLSVLIIIWSLVKSSLKETETLRVKAVELLRYKRQPLFFLKLLEKETRINDEIWNNDMILGNPSARIRIIVGCNPYCKPCADTHAYFHELLNRYSSDFCLILRFSINASNITSKKFIAASHLLESYFVLEEGKHGEPISDWFSQMNIEKWRTKWGIIAHSDYQELLLKHQEWSVNSKIDVTPTIFINGYKYPKFYRFEDIREIVPVLITNEI